MNGSKNGTERIGREGVIPRIVGWIGGLLLATSIGACGDAADIQLLTPDYSDHPLWIEIERLLQESDPGDAVEEVYDIEDPNEAQPFDTSLDAAEAEAQQSATETRVAALDGVDPRW